MALAYALLAVAALASPALAANKYCDTAFFWLPDGTSEPGGPNWASKGLTSSFQVGPCIGVSGIGMTETYKKTIIIIDRSMAANSYLTLADKPADNNLAFAQELNLLTLDQRPLDVITNTFCSSAQHVANGDMLSIGGDWASDYTQPGEFSIRTFVPCDDGACGFKVTDQLAKSRWYPTTALLGDGRVIVVGGSSRGVGINNKPANVPFIEYIPKPAGAADQSFEVEFLTDTLPYNLFPYVHLLPSGRLFLFAGEEWTLWDTLTNAVVPGVYPKVGAVDGAGNAIKFSYPVAGTSALFPLTSANAYTAEVIICGGSSTAAIFQVQNGVDKDGNPQYKITEDPLHPATTLCVRIFPEAAKPVWIKENMKLPRVMPVGVLLPDGHFLVLSGTQTGHSGLGQLSHKPALTPEMYDTATHTWYPVPLATSRIPRSYHSSAIILHDSTVLVTGSNPNSNIILTGNDFPSEFRTEYFHPPYFQKNLIPPVLIKAPPTVIHGTNFILSFRYAGLIKKINVVFAQPGFSTHGGNHGMRNVVLDVKALKTAGAIHVATVAVPVNKNVLPPTWYWSFVVVNGVPNREGNHIFVAK